VVWPLLWIFLAACFAKTGREDEAARHLDKLRQLMDDLTLERAPEYISKTFPFVPDYVGALTKDLEKGSAQFGRLHAQAYPKTLKRIRQ